ncbi:MAG: hypothetical protein M3400_02290 [Actinomycetota bacterium]|nr:hypothetical protein [Actinomycetota bacterium]
MAGSFAVELSPGARRRVPQEPADQPTTIRVPQGAVVVPALRSQRIALSRAEPDLSERTDEYVGRGFGQA